MRNKATIELDDLPKGIQRSRALPDARLGALWDSIILDERLKSQLLSQAVLNFTLRGKVDRSVIPLHGVILLVGPPGTGKTSLARGLAHRTAESFPGGTFRLLEVEPHTLTPPDWGLRSATAWTPPASSGRASCLWRRAAMRRLPSTMRGGAGMARRSRLGAPCSAPSSRCHDGVGNDSRRRDGQGEAAHG